MQIFFSIKISRLKIIFVFFYSAKITGVFHPCVYTAVCKAPNLRLLDEIQQGIGRQSSRFLVSSEYLMWTFMTSYVDVYEEEGAGTWVNFLEYILRATLYWRNFWFCQTHWIASRMACTWNILIVRIKIHIKNEWYTTSIAFNYRITLFVKISEWKIIMRSEHGKLHSVPCV